MSALFHNVRLVQWLPRFNTEHSTILPHGRDCTVKGEAWPWTLFTDFVSQLTFPILRLVGDESFRAWTLVNLICYQSVPKLQGMCGGRWDLCGYVYVYIFSCVRIDFGPPLFMTFKATTFDLLLLGSSRQAYRIDLHIRFLLLKLPHWVAQSIQRGSQTCRTTNIPRPSRLLLH